MDSRILLLKIQNLLLMLYAISGKPDSKNMATGGFFKKSEHTYLKNRSKNRIKMILAEAKSAGTYPPSKLQQYKENKGINHKV